MKVVKEEKGTIWKLYDKVLGDNKFVTIEVGRLREYYKTIHTNKDIKDDLRFIRGTSGKYLKSLGKYKRLPLIMYIDQNCLLDDRFFWGDIIAYTEKAQRILDILDILYSIYNEVANMGHLIGWYTSNTTEFDKFKQILSFYTKHSTEREVFDIRKATELKYEYDMQQKYGNVLKHYSIGEIQDLLDSIPLDDDTELSQNEILCMLNNKDRVEKFTEELSMFGVCVNSFITVYTHLYDWFKDYKNWCEIANKKVKANDNIIEECRHYYTYINRNNIDKDDMTIKKYQTEKQLQFENEDFIITVPKNKKEFIENGADMHNCFGGFEVENYVVTHQRYAVGIVNKATNQLVIDCDISVKTGQVQQYLGKYNNAISKYYNQYTEEFVDRALKFKKEYQEYLNTLWN